MRRIINLSNRLPVRLTPSIARSSGGLASALHRVAEVLELRWIGWPGRLTPESPGREELSRELSEQYGYLPVFLSERDIEGYYDGFSNSSLWPLLHYMPNKSDYDDAWFDRYRIVNRRFAERAVEIASEDDLVWVHDYHLMLVPRLIRELAPDLRVGFFLHTPFPSSEIFRCHPRRLELLSGLLGADLVGFHTYGYLRHFRSAVTRLLQIESDVDRVRVGRRQTVLGNYPIGIDWDSFSAALEDPRSVRAEKELDRVYHDVDVVLSVERLDYTKGIPKRLQAVERFLHENPERRENTAFVIIAVPSREDVGEYQIVKQEVEQAVSRINGRYATLRNTPIRFINQSLSHVELASLYRYADVALVTPLVDGMNLVAKEFIACQSGDPGVLILSEFAGAAQELFNAVLVNPYDVDGVAHAIATALDMSLDERQARMDPMRSRVIRHDATAWARNFLDHLETTTPARESSDEITAWPTEVQEVFDDPSRRKALFFDYDGTVIGFFPRAESAVPTPRLLRVLNKLGERPDLHLYLISGRAREFLDAHFSDLSLHLIAEHGAWQKSPGGRWLAFPSMRLSWMDSARQIVETYVDSTPGTSIEIKGTTVVWHYRNADPEFGQWKAGELVAHLTDLLANEPVEIHQGNRIVEVVSNQMSKGIAMERALSRSHYDLVVAAGDDYTDESMFQRGDLGVVSVKVGSGPTLARYRVAGPERFLELLESLESVPSSPARSGHR